MAAKSPSMKTSEDAKFQGRRLQDKHIANTWIFQGDDANIHLAQFWYDTFEFAAAIPPAMLDHLEAQFNIMTEDDRQLGVE